MKQSGKCQKRKRRQKPSAARVVHSPISGKWRPWSLLCFVRGTSVPALPRRTSSSPKYLPHAQTVSACKKNPLDLSHHHHHTAQQGLPLLMLIAIFFTLSLTHSLRYFTLPIFSTLFSFFPLFSIKIRWTLFTDRRSLSGMEIHRKFKFRPPAPPPPSLSG